VGLRVMKILVGLLLLLVGFALSGCSSDDSSMKPSDSIAGDLKNAGPATGEVGGKGEMKRAGN
jgi:hypothetical protein